MESVSGFVSKSPVRKAANISRNTTFSSFDGRYPQESEEDEDSAGEQTTRYWNPSIHDNMLSSSLSSDSGFNPVESGPNSVNSTAPSSPVIQQRRRPSALTFTEAKRPGLDRTTTDPTLVRNPSTSTSHPVYPQSPYPFLPPDEATPLINSNPPNVTKRRPRPTPSSFSFRKSLVRAKSLVTLKGPNYYDEGFFSGDDGDGLEEEEEGGRHNGSRAWYSSFTSIDWVHDQIKSSSTSRKLHNKAKRSVSGKLSLLWDRSQGWLVVTLVGIITAFIAFCIVRAEGLLFDLKTGYCNTPGFLNKFKSQGFCCRGQEGDNLASGESFCPGWTPWSQVLLPNHPSIEEWMVEYSTYIILAVALATISSLLTLTTKSTSFETRKDGDVLKGIKASDQGRKVMYYASGSGIPEIKAILSGFVIHGFLGGWTLFVKSVGLTLSVASGLSLGKEGPMVHIACSIGNIVTRFFHKFETNEAKRREVLSAAAAAGVAVAFGAPIGGVLFSLEEVSFYFPPKVMWRSFWCACVAVTTLKALDPFDTGKIVLFQVHYTNDWHFVELGMFLLIGIVMGVYGAAFSRGNVAWGRFKRSWIKNHFVLEVICVTAFTAIFSFLNEFSAMSGTELVLNLLSQCSPLEESPICVSHLSQTWGVIQSIGLAMILKGLITIITFGIKVPAGIFIPTLGVGACFGRIVGLALQALQFKYPELIPFPIVPGVYAMVGAAAALSGVTRTTVSLAVIMFELTNSLNFTVPVIIGVLAAKTVGDSLERKGIYDLVIEMNELPYLDAKASHRWGSLQVSDVSERPGDVIFLDAENTVASILYKLKSLVRAGLHDGGLPLVKKENRGLRLCGFISANELEYALGSVMEEPHAKVNFEPQTRNSSMHVMRESTTSLYGATSAFSTPRTATFPTDFVDFSRFVDQAPLSVITHSSLELVQQLFVKLGVRQVMVSDPDGFFVGVIHKRQWLHFLEEVEESN